jgi:hypothetical protein
MWGKLETRVLTGLQWEGKSTTGSDGGFTNPSLDEQIIPVQIPGCKSQLLFCQSHHQQSAYKRALSMHCSYLTN